MLSVERCVSDSDKAAQSDLYWKPQPRPFIGLSARSSKFRVTFLRRSCCSPMPADYFFGSWSVTGVGGQLWARPLFYPCAAERAACFVRHDSFPSLLPFQPVDL